MRYLFNLLANSTKFLRRAANLLPKCLYYRMILAHIKEMFGIVSNNDSIASVHILITTRSTLPLKAKPLSGILIFSDALKAAS